MVNADDFTYSKGYLALLSELGASLGITFCCAPSMPAVYHHCREAYSQRKKMGTLYGRTVVGDRVLFRSRIPVDEENSAINSDTPHETPLPMPDDSATKIHSRSARFNVDGCDADSNPPPDRGLRRIHTFSDVSDQLIPRCRALSIDRQSPRQFSSQIDGLGFQHEGSKFIPFSPLAKKEAQCFSQGAQWPEPVVQRPGLIKRSYSDSSRSVQSLDWLSQTIEQVRSIGPLD